MLLHSLMRLRVPLLRPQILLYLHSLLRVMGICLPSPPLLLGVLQALLHLVPRVTLVHRQSRRLARRRSRSPPKITLRHAWLTLFTRSALPRHSKPLSQIIPSRSRNYAVADRPLFAASLTVNPSFAQLAGTRTVGLRRWGSISFSEMEWLERLFRAQLEMTSSSLWLMSGILAMLKRDGFQPTDPTLFNAALASASATLSQQDRSSSAGSAFL